MKPAEYLCHLDACAEREGFGSSDLRPCASADIMSVERETGMSLPEEYVDFLCEAGAGEEHGGLARWFHVDLTRPGNVVDHSRALMNEQVKQLKDTGQPVSSWPRGLLVVHDSCDGIVYGFVPNGNSNYKPTVYGWDCDEGGLEPVADGFFDFLDFLASESPC